MVQSPPPGRTCGPFSPTRENLWSSLLHQGEPVAQSPPPGRTCGPASPSRENLWSASTTFENRDSASYTRETLRSCLPHQGESAVLSPLPGKPVAQPPPPGRTCGPVFSTRENLWSRLHISENFAAKHKRQASRLLVL